MKKKIFDFGLKFFWIINENFHFFKFEIPPSIVKLITKKIWKWIKFFVNYMFKAKSLCREIF